MKFSDKIMTLRKRKGWSQEELANQLDVSRQAIYKWEKGMCFPQADNLMALAKLFGVNPNDIMVEKDTYDTSKLFETLICFMKAKKKQNTVYSIQLAVGFMCEQYKI